jgi:hypothetical protein
MFPPAVLPHDATLRRLRALSASIAPSQVGDAFLSSLGSRELALRSALGSFAVARFRPAHAFVPAGHSRACRTCGLHLAPGDAETENLNVLNFERLKWGGVRHTYANYQVLDLEEFQKLEPPPPTEEEISIFHDILATVRTLPPIATVGHLERALSTTVRSSKNERRQLIEVLCLSGVLSYPGYRTYFDRDEPPKGRPYRDSDWGVPAIYWRAQDGYSVEHLKCYFPNFVPISDNE